MSAVNWLQALAEDDALVEVEAVVEVVDAADAVELEEAELSDSRSSAIACTSASSSASRLLALDEDVLEVDDVDEAAAVPGGGRQAAGLPAAVRRPPAKRNSLPNSPRAGRSGSRAAPTSARAGNFRSPPPNCWPKTRMRRSIATTSTRCLSRR